MKIEHIAIWVQNLDLLKEFYEKYFGAVAGEKYRNEGKKFSSYFLTFSSGARLELMQRSDISKLERDHHKEYIGFAHIAIALKDEEAVISLTQTLVANGLPLIDGPRYTGDGYYESVILDPEGNRLEITADKQLNSDSFIENQ